MLASQFELITVPLQQLWLQKRSLGEVLGSGLSAVVTLAETPQG